MAVRPALVHAGRLVGPASLLPVEVSVPLGGTVTVELGGSEGDREGEGGPVMSADVHVA